MRIEIVLPYDVFQYILLKLDEICWSQHNIMWEVKLARRLLKKMKTNLCDEPWRVRLFPYEFHKTGRKSTSLQEKTRADESQSSKSGKAVQKD